MFYYRFSDNNPDKNLVFDKQTGMFIVKVVVTPEEYGLLAHKQVIADVKGLVFDKENGHFLVPVYMTPEEYGTYVKDAILPYR